MRNGLTMAAAVAAMLAAGAAEAQTAAPCPRTVAPPAELAGWSAMRPKAAAAGPAALSGAMLAIGEGTRATLLPAGRVSYAMTPDKPGAAATHGGLFAFDVADAGRYRVALGAGAWIDVVADGKAAASVSHGHGPDCSGIRKMVDFDLAPGRYVLQLAGNAEPVLALMVARVSR